MWPVSYTHLEGMKKYKKRSVAILISVILLLAFTVVFMLSFLDRINAKMNQGSNETLMNSTPVSYTHLNTCLSKFFNRKPLKNAIFMVVYFLDKKLP